MTRPNSPVPCHVHLTPMGGRAVPGHCAGRPHGLLSDWSPMCSSPSSPHVFFLFFSWHDLFPWQPLPSSSHTAIFNFNSLMKSCPAHVNTQRRPAFFTKEADAHGALFVCRFSCDRLLKERTEQSKATAVRRG